MLTVVIVVVVGITVVKVSVLGAPALVAVVYLVVRELRVVVSYSILEPVRHHTIR